MKKIFKILIPVIIVAVLAIVYTLSPFCDNGVALDVNDRSTYFDETPNIFTMPSYFTVQRIHEGMSFSEVVEVLGKPQTDVGSGHSIPTWYLAGGGSFSLVLSPEYEVMSIVEETVTKARNIFFIEVMLLFVICAVLVYFIVRRKKINNCP